MSLLALPEQNWDHHKMHLEQKVRYKKAPQRHFGRTQVYPGKARSLGLTHREVDVSLAAVPLPEIRFHRHACVCVVQCEGVVLRRCARVDSYREIENCYCAIVSLHGVMANSHGLA